MLSSAILFSLILWLIIACPLYVLQRYLKKEDPPHFSIDIPFSDCKNREVDVKYLHEPGKEPPRYFFLHDSEGEVTVMDLLLVKNKYLVYSNPIRQLYLTFRMYP